MGPDALVVNYVVISGRDGGASLQLHTNNLKFSMIRNLY
jgi:hypothetical protein